MIAYCSGYEDRAPVTIGARRDPDLDRPPAGEDWAEAARSPSDRPNASTSTASPARRPVKRSDRTDPLSLIRRPRRLT